MRPEHYLCLTLTPAAQALLLLCAIPRNHADPLSIPIAIVALLVPMGCYVWGLRTAPVLPKITSRPLRLALVGLMAVGLSIAGFVYGLQVITAHTVAAAS